MPFSCLAGAGLLRFLRFDYAWLNEQHEVLKTAGTLAAVCCICGGLLVIAIRRARLIEIARSQWMGHVVVALEAHTATNTDALGSLRGVIKLDSRTLTVKEAIPLASEMCSVTTEADAIWDPLSFVVVPDGSQERFICIATRHEFEDQWSAWELHRGDKFGTQIVSAPFLIGGLHKKRSELDDFESKNYSPSGLNARWVGGSRIILQLFNDSAWLVDLEPPKATILFHPGGEMTRIAVGRNSFAIFYRGGYKCYVVSSS